MDTQRCTFFGEEVFAMVANFRLIVYKRIFIRTDRTEE